MTEDQEFPSSGNIFTGNVSSVSEISSSLPITPVDPKRFIWSQFFIGLLLVPIIAGFLVALITLISEDSNNDTEYYDYHFFNEGYNPGTIIISDEEYNTWEANFEIPEISLDEIENNDYWFNTGISIYTDDWGDCYFDIDMSIQVIQSDDGSVWYVLECYGLLKDSNTFLHISGQNFTFATDYDGVIDQAYVNGDQDMSLDSILLSFLPFLIPIFYICLIVWSFVKKKQSLGAGLLGGIFVAPVSFCFSFIFLAFMFQDSGW